MKTNKSVVGPRVKTHEGGQAVNTNAYSQLRRSVLSCLLWEKEFYESGEEIADRIEKLAGQVDVDQLASLCIEARTDFNLRHVPLLLLCALIKRGGQLVGDTIRDTITRADELSELVSLYWRKGKSPLSKQMKIGLGAAFRKFNEYQLAKYNQDRSVKLRDVLFLTHAKPEDKKQAALWKRLVNGDLKTPDTWEVQLSAGKDKRETFERLIREGGLGYLALLRNLRNMTEAGCDIDLVEAAIRARKGADRVLPFRYIAAARCAPAYSNALNDAMLATIKDLRQFDGTTLILVDVSGSMDDKLSSKSDMTRMDAAVALGVLWPGRKRVVTFSQDLVECHAWAGLPGVDSIIRSQPHGGTYLSQAIAACERLPHDRLIVITDEQSADGCIKPAQGIRGYLINVASAKNGVGYGPHWTHLDGFSESVFRFIYEIENENNR